MTPVLYQTHPQTYIHVCIYTHTYIYTHIHINTHTYIHTYIHTNMHAYIHIQTKRVQGCSQVLQAPDIPYPSKDNTTLAFPNISYHIPTRYNTDSLRILYPQFRSNEGRSPFFPLQVSSFLSCYGMSLSPLSLSLSLFLV